MNADRRVDNEHLHSVSSGRCPANAPAKLRRACAATHPPPISRAPAASAGCWASPSLLHYFLRSEDELFNRVHQTSGQALQPDDKPAVWIQIEHEEPVSSPHIANGHALGPGR